ncbi:thymidylate kinase [Streptacidiphilus sp. BW17]|uniref:AAA family ATPase n=1 Tax=unclassified Streptacidiphilus TaxID=2643834 RepID=UPI003512922C
MTSPLGEPRFIVLEGLSATGKTTVAPLLADALGAVLLDTLNARFEPMRRNVDASRNVMARMNFWMMVNYLASDTVRATLATGRSVVMESYFYRTLATHAAMGVTPVPEIDWSHARRPDNSFVLTVDDAIRRQRLDARDEEKNRSYWYRLEADNIHVTRKIYAGANIVPVDTTGLRPDGVVKAIVDLLPEGMG